MLYNFAAFNSINMHNSELNAFAGGGQALKGVQVGAGKNAAGGDGISMGDDLRKGMKTVGEGVVNFGAHGRELGFVEGRWNACHMRD